MGNVMSNLETFAWVGELLHNANKGVELLRNAIRGVKLLYNANGLDEKLEKLIRKVELLKGKKIDINMVVENMELREKKQRKKEVQNWFKQVERIEDKVQNVVKEVQKSGVLSRTFKWVYQVEKLYREVMELFDHSSFPQGLTHDLMDPSVTTKVMGNVYQKMACQEQVNEVGALNLFLEILGDGGVLPPKVSDIAKSIVKECAGSTLGIIIVAGSMKGVGIDIYEWRNALNELNVSLVGMEDKLLGVLQFSYSCLIDPNLRICFLHCSLYLKDIKISRDDLITLLIDDGIIEGKKNREEKFIYCHTMLNKLENVYLLEGLEDLNEVKCVKMHALVRDAALKIARKEVAGKGLRDLPNEEKWKDALESKINPVERKDVPTSSLTRSPISCQLNKTVGDNPMAEHGEMHAEGHEERHDEIREGRHGRHEERQEMPTDMVSIIDCREKILGKRPMKDEDDEQVHLSNQSAPLLMVE